MNTNQTVAYLVKNCPDFYFLPTCTYDQVFKEYGEEKDKKSPAYWKSRGFEIHELEVCEIPVCEWCLYSSNGVHWNFEKVKTYQRDMGIESWRSEAYPFVIFVKERI